MSPGRSVARCADIAPLVDELIDGTLDERRASAVRGHLRTCAACAARHEETRLIAEQLGGLGPIDPPPTLWARIDARLAGEEVTDANRPKWWWWWQAWRRPIAYGAALGAAGALAIGLYVAKRPAADRGSASAHAKNAITPTPVPPESPEPQLQPQPSVPPPSKYDLAAARVADLDREYAAAVADLKKAAQEERAHWRPEVAKAFDENLAVIDAAVEKQRLAAHDQPGDVTALDALHDSYERQIGFLQEAVVRGEVAR